MGGGLCGVHQTKWIWGGFEGGKGLTGLSQAAIIATNLKSNPQGCIKGCFTEGPHCLF